MEINLLMFLNSLKKRRHSRRNIVFTYFLLLLYSKTNLTICLRSADVYQCLHNLILWRKCPNQHEVPLNTRALFHARTLFNTNIPLIARTFLLLHGHCFNYQETSLINRTSINCGDTPFITRTCQP